MCQHLRARVPTCPRARVPAARAHPAACPRACVYEHPRYPTRLRACTPAHARAPARVDSTPTHARSHCGWPPQLEFEAAKVKPVFITFEGGDGAGKSTQARMLAEWLQAQGHEAIQTEEPGGTPLGQALRDVLLFGDDMNPRAEALIYAADRSHHIDTVVKPALDAGSIVISDRYFDSSVAYQGVGRGLGAEWIEKVNLWGAGGLRPDLTILLDLDPRQLPQRITRDLDRLERAGEEFHERTRQAFLDRAASEPERFVIVDASPGIDAVAATVREIVADRLGIAT